MDIPIGAAKKIATEYNYDQVIIIGRKVGRNEHVTTYGIDKTHCSMAAKIGDFLKYKVMNWVKEYGNKNENEATDKSISVTIAKDVAEFKWDEAAFRISIKEVGCTKGLKIHKVNRNEDSRNSICIEPGSSNEIMLY